MEIDELIQECIDNLSDDSIGKGAECLVELAIKWAKAGLPQSSFNDMRKYIIEEAITRTDKLFIQEKLLLTERKLRDERNGHKKIISIQNKGIIQ